MFKITSASSRLAILSIGLFISLSGCSSDGEERPDYLDANSIQNLQIPPKLTHPNTSGALRIPEPSAKAKAAFNDKQGAEKAVAPQFKGVRLKNDSRLYWLEIDSSVESVWSILPGFLAAEGIAVERVEKLLGFVDTQWMDEYKITYANESSSSSWFGGFAPDYRDKFRLRVVALPGENKTRLFVTHRGVQIVLDDDGTQWQQRESEALLEREIMYRYMLFVGASKAGATDLLADYRSYKSRVTVNEENLASFKVLGAQDTVWLRLKIAMDRLGVSTLKVDQKNGKMDVLIGSLNVVADADKASEDKGWFGSLFGGDIDVDDGGEDYESASTYKEKVSTDEDKFIVHVQQIAGQYASTIQLSNESGSELKEGRGLYFRNALVKQLK